MVQPFWLLAWPPLTHPSSSPSPVPGGQILGQTKSRCELLGKAKSSLGRTNRLGTVGMGNAAPTGQHVTPRDQAGGGHRPGASVADVEPRHGAVGGPSLELGRGWSQDTPGSCGWGAALGPAEWWGGLQQTLRLQLSCSEVPGEFLMGPPADCSRILGAQRKAPHRPNPPCKQAESGTGSTIGWTAWRGSGGTFPVLSR